MTSTLPLLQAGGDDSQAQLRVEAKTVEPTTQDNLRVSVTRRDWLLQEKQQLQKEIEALQARMSVLEAKEQQLRQEIDEQEQLLPWQGCDLSPLLGGLTPRELQEVHDTLRDTLASASRVPLRAEPPEAIRSLQEGIKSLNLSLKEITAKVCMSERLCSTLRKKLNDIEIQMPALLEAKMLAIAASIKALCCLPLKLSSVDVTHALLVPALPCWSHPPLLIWSLC
ncbi:hypothetical protein CB1_000692012 [Camelus ferus]|nr:hypothetical protein CB1_000692012 [Camelus ferus]